MLIGAHVSISKGLKGAVQAAVKMQANTFQFFSRNPRGGQARKLEERDIKEAHEIMAHHNFGPVVAHAPYTYNLASVKPGVREFTIRTIKDDLLRTKTMEVPNLVLHVGTHGGQGEEMGLSLVIQGLNEILTEINSDRQFLLIEGMAGEGTELGVTFAQIKEIIKGCNNHPQLGVCLDSCHLLGAGYDLTRWDEVKEEFKQEIGWERLKALHLNDSKYPLGSKRDRHAKLGEGYLGLETIKKLISDEDLHKIPLILETPNDDEGYAQEISLLKSMLP